MSLPLLGVGGRTRTGKSMADHYLFIDGRYLDLAYADLIGRFLGLDGDLDVKTVVSHVSPQRTYYYNAVDDEQHQGEDEATYTARVDATIARFDNINALPATHVRYGSITGKSIKRKRQKQVDVQLAVDALLHAFNRNVGIVTLIAGDLDFKPLIEALNTLGVNTRVWYERRSASVELYKTADHASEISLDVAWSWSSLDFRDNHPIPRVSRNSEPDMAGVHERIGTWRGREIRTVKRTRNKYPYVIFALSHERENSLAVEAHDLALLDRYFEFVFGKPEWTDYAKN